MKIGTEKKDESLGLFNTYLNIFFSSRSLNDQGEIEANKKANTE